MTPNSENAMARFLLAILNQKNLKDIDWNQVAADPVLLQPITNGHAARMRFARFRATVNGHEPQKRNRTADKSRVTKSKKTQPAKRESLIKAETGVNLSSYAQVRPSPKIKQEPSQPGYLAQFSPASTSSPYLTDNRDDMNPRFLTPCSDDMTHSLAINPASLEDLRLRNGFGPSMDCPQDIMAPPSHDFTLGQSTFDTFDAAYDLTAYKTAVGGGQSPVNIDFGAASLADCSPEWTDHFNDHHF
ncbi:uncharacterized protein NECHADRAFT_99943 [Fusarium vanettenii 77-13-4]|uniref:Myb-like DNA-binding domain-containing protein n=1 Tax=Fusarium vanettenii (strain ATCC MYA-4622 / CBS 123669 / FGSC 9596 / NRRL 45880 / 77-13-4) TaxID=660122 RepID=C7YPI3_FUSV7|nr:uncharacterized protein NECHADRAFT_99943 [Fusarium vanettenii 77-13-4]EEU45848.1 hypothetical protein NECHADRAFT_99943 [Fusarium vanettenii 77-13-4]